MIKLQVKMEANRKLRGYVKGKLMSFYRTAKPSSTVQYTTASIKFQVQQDNCVFAQPKQKVSFIVQDNNRDLMTSYDNIYGVPGDESVDMKAASYISSAQERFKT